MSTWEWARLIPQSKQQNRLGNIEIELEDRIIELSEGEMFIVPKGAKHKPIARGEAYIMLI